MKITERERLERLFVEDTGVFPPGMDKASIAIDGNEGYDARELAFRLWRELRSLRESCEADGGENVQGGCESKRDLDNEGHNRDVASLQNPD